MRLFHCYQGQPNPIDRLLECGPNARQITYNKNKNKAGREGRRHIGPASGSVTIDLPNVGNESCLYVSPRTRQSVLIIPTGIMHMRHHRWSYAMERLLVGYSLHAPLLSELKKKGERDKRCESCEIRSLVRP